MLNVLTVACYACVKAYYILDEILIAGELQESSKKTVARLIAAQVTHGLGIFCWSLCKICFLDIQIFGFVGFTGGGCERAGELH